MALVTTAVGAIAQMFTTSEERLAQIKDQISQIDEKTALIDEVRQLKEEYDELNGVSNKSNEQMARFSELKKSIPSLLEQITGETVAYENMEQVIENLNAQYAEMVEYRQQLASQALVEADKGYSEALDKRWWFFGDETV